MLIKMNNLFILSQGEVADAIMYMEKFMTIAKRVQLNQSLVDACTFLGNIYNTSVSINLRSDTKVNTKDARICILLLY